jgi:hypothetical protein
MYSSPGHAKQRTSLCRLGWRRPVATRSHQWVHDSLSFIPNAILIKLSQYQIIHLRGEALYTVAHLQVQP